MEEDDDNGLEDCFSLFSFYIYFVMVYKYESVFVRVDIILDAVL